MTDLERDQGCQDGPCKYGLGPLGGLEGNHVSERHDGFIHTGKSVLKWPQLRQDGFFLQEQVLLGSAVMKNNTHVDPGDTDAFILSFERGIPSRNLITSTCHALFKLQSYNTSPTIPKICSSSPPRNLISNRELQATDNLCSLFRRGLPTQCSISRSM